MTEPDICATPPPTAQDVLSAARLAMNTARDVHAVRILASPKFYDLLKDSSELLNDAETRYVYDYCRLFGLPVVKHELVGGGTLALVEMSDGTFRRISDKDKPHG